MRSRRWILIGLVLAGGMPSGDTDERKASEGPQASRFERLLKRHPNDPTLHYNLGTVRYRHGRYDTAEESLKRAIASAGSSLQGRASYNLGNTHYRLGAAAAQAAPTQAIDFYQQALEDYRLAIRQDPNDADAKYNYEVVERRLKALKAQQARQSATGQQQGGHQEAAQAHQANAQQAQGEQAQQEQQQQAVSTEQKSDSESTASTEAAQSPEQSHKSQQARAAPPQPRQPGSAQHTQTATEPQDLSEQQALWILDNLKNEERGALGKEHQGPAREADVEQDW